MALIEYQIKDRVAYITLNRPEKRNALNREVVDLLSSAFIRAGEDSEAKIIVLKATGEVFSAGADLEYLQKLQENTYNDNLADSTSLKDLFQLIYTHTKVVIAQVQGHAIAGGCGLATVCDFVFAQPEAKFGYTEVRIGFVPAIVMVYLLRRIGEGRAREMLISGALIDAQLAAGWGLVNKVIPAAELASAVDEFAQRLVVNNSYQSMQRTKAMIAQVQEMKLEDALEFAADHNARARSTEDCQRGIKAFLDKKSIKW
jgi:methylglutaconyl-CoA hydratase